MRVGDSLFSNPLRPEEPGALNRGGVEGAEEDEPVDSVALGRLKQADLREFRDFVDSVRKQAS